MLRTRERERRNRRAINGTGSDRETKVETISASGINTEQIYEGERIENKKLEPLKDKKIDIDKKLSSNKPTIPCTIADEIKTNIFLRCNDPEIKHRLGLKDSSDVEVFSKLRDLKDSF